MSLVARAITNAGISIFFYTDRRPCLILHNNNAISKSAALSNVTTIAHAAMAAFVNQHYRTAFPAAKLRTAAPVVTNKWLTEPTTFSPEVYTDYMPPPVSAFYL